MAVTKAERTAAFKALNQAVTQTTKAMEKLTKDAGRAYQVCAAAKARLEQAASLLGVSVVEPQPEEVEVVADEAEPSEVD